MCYDGFYCKAPFLKAYVKWRTSVKGTITKYIFPEELNDETISTNNDKTKQHMP